uniref:Uncharacterized protein n=1 Tax=Janthinobacterium lividum TaxID=29581 RepID=A0SYX3_9BURK|nr:hypothetical protein [Janthinobacterium lividum]
MWASAQSAPAIGLEWGHRGTSAAPLTVCEASHEKPLDEHVPERRQPHRQHGTRPRHGRRQARSGKEYAAIDASVVRLFPARGRQATAQPQGEIRAVTSNNWCGASQQ